MERHLKEFNSISESEDYLEENEIEGPYVFYCNGNTNHVIYSGVEKIKLVNMGLPSGTLWASEPIKNGDGDVLYFAWGETSGYTEEQAGNERDFDYSSYKFKASIRDNPYNKYHINDRLTELEPEDDAATQILGEEYQIPTPGHWYELLENCNITIKINDFDENEVKDSIEVELESKINGKKIILPSYSFCRYDGIFFTLNSPYYYQYFTYQTNTISSSSYEYIIGLGCHCSGPYDIDGYYDVNDVNKEGDYISLGDSDLNTNFYRYRGRPILAVKKGSYIPAEPPVNVK